MSLCPDESVPLRGEIHRSREEVHDSHGNQCQYQPVLLPKAFFFLRLIHKPPPQKRRPRADSPKNRVMPENKMMHSAKSVKAPYSPRTVGKGSSVAFCIKLLNQV